MIDKLDRKAIGKIRDLFGKIDQKLTNKVYDKEIIDSLEALEKILLEFQEPSSRVSANEVENMKIAVKGFFTEELPEGDKDKLMVIINRLKSMTKSWLTALDAREKEIEKKSE